MKKTFFISMIAIFAMNSCDLDVDDENRVVVCPFEGINLTSVEKEIVSAEKQNAMTIFSKVAKKEAYSDAAVVSDSKSNFMISPFSLNMALTMAWNGAKGETQEAIEKALGYKPEYREALNAYYNKMGRAFVAIDPSTKLAIANSVWYNKDFLLKSTFRKVNEQYYYATVRDVDFTDSKTKDLMNKWCEDNTNGLIKKVIDETSGDDLMYLMNALYFKGTWSKGFAFKTSDTQQEDFTTDSGNKVKVSMMHQNTEMIYQENATFSAVKLPYGNGAYSMIVLLPKGENTVVQMAEKLAAEKSFVGLMQNFGKAKVNLAMPRFKFKYDIKLNEILKELGMANAFTGDADFSNAFENAQAQISYVQQFTSVEVNEKGTEAAAVTVVGMVNAAAPAKENVDFTVDRPFAFVIQENSTGSILFMGKVGNPNK